MVIDAIGAIKEDVQVRDRPMPMKYSSDEIGDNGYEGTDPFHNQSSCQPEEIKQEDCELQDQADRRIEKVSNTKTDKETTRDESASDKMYHHEGGELFAEDVEQHMEGLPDLNVPTQ